MEVKNKQLSICVGVCKKVADIAVCMCIPYNGCWHCLNALKYNMPCDHSTHKGSEHSALLFSVFECIRDKFIGSPLELMKSRVSHVNCNLQNGQMVISWNTQGSMSSLRKTISLALSCLSPQKLFSKYSENMKLISGKSNRGEFGTCANDLIASIKKEICISVVGKINIDNKKLKAVSDSVYKKLPASEPISSKDTEQIPKNDEYVEIYPSIKASGISAVAVADYIRNKAGGMNVLVNSDSVIIYNKLWETKRKTLKQMPRIKDYVDKKYIKLGDHFYLIFAYLAITQGITDCGTIQKILKNKPTASSMKELISKAL
jgi:hypothetical protein